MPPRSSTWSAPGHVYSRISNPTNAVLEERVAALEGGAGRSPPPAARRRCTWRSPPSPAPARTWSPRALYGGSHNLLHYTLSRFGISTSFVKPGDFAAWRAAIRPETRLLFGETLGNPGLDVLDIPTVAAIAHENDLPLLVDSTFTTPWLMKPFEHGADLLYHSATKFLSGHGTVIGGVLVDSGRFDWNAATARSGRFTELTRPYDGFHDMVFSDESTVGASCCAPGAKACATSAPA
jgi:O-acetylhomoserine (thiol)-lyase